jgi:inosine/xanthosine triphosphate pyrophosphatase family protein
MKDLLLATTNAGKIKEISEILAMCRTGCSRRRISVWTLVVSENSDSYFGNARLKASHTQPQLHSPPWRMIPGWRSKRWAETPRPFRAVFSPTPSATDREPLASIFWKN